MGDDTDSCITLYLGGGFKVGMRTLPIAVVISLVVGFAAGYITLQLIQQPQLESLQAELKARDDTINLLNIQITQLRNDFNRISSDLSSEKSNVVILQNTLDDYRKQVVDLENRVSALVASLEEARVKTSSSLSKLDQALSVLDTLQNDRILLSWMNRDLPGTREGDREFWNETRALAAKSEPSLVFTVDRILDNLDIYYDWQERFPNPAGNTREDLINWCPLFIDWLFAQPPGADQYNQYVNQLREEILLVVISHIDSMARALES
jgi:uncharacterized membrane-anchored protein YhcB (DUF1043 family)